MENKKNSFSESYNKAGVDINAGYKAVHLIKPLVSKTFTSGVLTGIGGFGGLFEPDLSGIKRPVLVSGTDGVGTKLKIAFMLDKHDTVGIDCVAMCANDVACAGASPLFFLDYIATGKNIPEKIASIVSGVANGCMEAGCALIGGETAEMPGFYPENEYDLAGFCVGMTDYDRIIDGSGVSSGDLLIGLPSSGVHSNGFSLIRKILSDTGVSLSVYSEELGSTLGEALLTPTRIYCKPLLAAAKAAKIKAVSHITGGGFFENIPRMLPKGVMAVIDKQSIPVPPIFRLLADMGHIPERDMFNTYNMGVGMVIAAAPDMSGKLLDSLRAAGEKPLVIGECAPGDNGLELR